MTTQLFIGLLDRVTQTRRGWIGRCPAHEDKSPSLSIGEAEDGRILVKCWTGCTVSAIVTALGLKLRDLFPDRRLSGAEVALARRQRKAKCAAEKKKHQREGVRIDRLREAESLLYTAVDINIAKWSHAKLDRMLNLLADAHAVLEKEEGRDE